MPPNKSALNDDKNYHLQMERLDKERIKLAERLIELCQQEKIIQSQQNNGHENQCSKKHSVNN
ncbi:MAG: hypothetical protein KKD33_09325 [Verrucomicrobia bacterium]|nr:hypothetical protein [Verrucomicrobiota bacterium]